MCGILFVEQPCGGPIGPAEFSRALERQTWRGPDATRMSVIQDGAVLLGHNRLSIIDPVAASDQPMKSANGRYEIIFNGEIYNHMLLRERFKLRCRRSSDTETIIELFAQLGTEAFVLLEGMFALVLFDHETRRWWAVRDRVGIKPLYFARQGNATIIASEPATINVLVPSGIDAASLEELRVARRPVPGHTYFKAVKELLPGNILCSDGTIERFGARQGVSPVAFRQDDLEALLAESVGSHEMSDVPVVSMLSGGIDSALIARLSRTRQTYCVGLTDNNEGAAAAETAHALDKKITITLVQHADIRKTWRDLCAIRGEPLSVPNEALIYTCCQAMGSEEKVVLTGEGADELFFGYDRIFRWATDQVEWPGAAAFLQVYGYADVTPAVARLMDYVETLRGNSSTQDLVEDFFLEFHLPGLLRRMDFAAMAASKEARVPFLSTALLTYMYRRPASLRIDKMYGKLPLRTACRNLGISGTLERAKIGFSATPTQMTRHQEYKQFYDLCLEELRWS